MYARLAQAEAVVLNFFVTELLRINPRVHDPEYTARILHASGRELLRLHLCDPQTATVERLGTFVRRLGAPA
ncbi:hypothetical protein [Mycobacterium sherrisii]|uniref:TetR family transcriptional regulator n=1 Tax=Mycobacterium sherrisii TaxID=243061 RepID=A0A1E3T975_9MYCO|nr:hypothetical protein [Mycobacterium sherrisii]MCV7031607.1 hypothetical protein [Mycobacterium sherrisii]MEC4765008.1 hypothetical protein [Mycobacterium sherrisii]ODR11029.1 hypothetical protein BHQ21_01310 [Mycobacterium sherrisii]ORW86073.1 hypothetical protein AWC25_21340 [Mycobacterium sherrisii]